MAHRSAVRVPRTGPPLRRRRSTLATLHDTRREDSWVSDDRPAQISDEDIEGAIAFLQQALECSGDEDRRERLGVAVRSITRMWAIANPEFSGDAWYPVSFMLTEHWAEIRTYMENADS